MEGILHKTSHLQLKGFKDSSISCQEKKKKKKKAPSSKEKEHTYNRQVNPYKLSNLHVQMELETQHNGSLTSTIGDANISWHKNLSLY